ncbi:MAG TPA: NAD-dependent epimerase/dehydratase family protein [Flavobacteriales bacterium]|nr:NAD-dependent epimerase/dehydratase family protein [Flavobacteriales bacterium]
MILVTGGTGLVGSHVLLQLCKQKQAIRALYRPGSNRELVRKIFTYYSPANDALFNAIEWVEGDITDVLSLEDAMKGVDYVYHCAALVSFKKQDREKLQKINVEGTYNVVNACLDAGIKKLCYVSSTAALGKGEENKLLNETDMWTLEPDISNYSISKHKAEQEVWRGSEEGLNVVMVNPCLVVGPHNWNIGSTAVFKNVYRGLKWYTPGSNAVVDVRVVADAMVRLMESDITAQRFLVITENVNFKDFCTLMAQAMDKNPPRRQVSRFVAALGRRVEAIRAKFTGTEPRITKETLQAAFKNFSYNSEKLKKALPDMHTSTAKEAVENAVGFFKKEYFQNFK